MALTVTEAERQARNESHQYGGNNEWTVCTYDHEMRAWYESGGMSWAMACTQLREWRRQRTVALLIEAGRVDAAVAYVVRVDPRNETRLRTEMEMMREDAS